MLGIPLYHFPQGIVVLTEPRARLLASKPQKSCVCPISTLSPGVTDMHVTTYITLSRDVGDLNLGLHAYPLSHPPVLGLNNFYAVLWLLICSLCCGTINILF